MLHDSEALAKRPWDGGTDSEFGSRSTEGTPASTPRTITYYLLIEPAMHSATVLHRANDDAAIRAAMLSLAAQVSPLAAAGLIAELPGLTGNDPRLSAWPKILSVTLG